MSSEPLVLRAEGISKRYRIGHREPYKALRDVVTDALGSVVRLGPRRSEPVSIWALRDVSFEMRRGEVLGLMGANGAGKSTLLKILSRITEPTEGRAVLSGRVGSLLEVGTGFHPELTGRENIYLNGTILGMRRAEINARFDEIVDFSGMSKFLDTPVKRYSSGMQVRLAFAVAAHLQPEILLVDEVLAVGDAEFQEKCLGKMKDVTREGRTVVFVSHNLVAMRSLCPRALVLDGGGLVFDGETDEAVHRYLGHGGEPSAAVMEERELEARVSASHVFGETPFFRCTRVAVLDEAGSPATSFRSDEEITLAIDYVVSNAVAGLKLSVALTDANQAAVLRTESADDPATDRPGIDPGAYRATVRLPAGLLGDAHLDVSVGFVSELRQVLEYSGVAELDVRFAGHGANMHGGAYLRPSLVWSVEPLGVAEPARAG
jgi:lipopolysaccharide transport system ATP-binding protein